MATNVERYKNVCRACLSANNDMQDLFNTEMNGSTLDQIFSMCTGSAVEHVDSFPTCICAGCVENLRIVYNFQEMCRSSEQELRQVLCAINTESEVKVMKIEVAAADAIVDVQEQTCQVSKAEPMEEITIDENIAPNLDNTSDSVVADASISSNPPTAGAMRNKTYLCTICDKSFDRSVRFQRHIKIHNAESKPYECSTCKKRFASESNLTRHMICHSDLMDQSLQASHPKSSSFKCRECNKKFVKQESMAAHMKTHLKSDDNGQKFQCDYCLKTFCYRNKLTRHIKMHAEQRKFKCNMDHLNRHNDVKPHVCLVCHKGMAS